MNLHLSDDQTLKKNSSQSQFTGAGIRMELNTQVCFSALLEVIIPVAKLLISLSNC